ncbi:MAG TPA: xanthine dehydrogenase family protein molybdopterin-binding subunit [Ilumatobacter sp.]|nr:xanthine dehydrogenase family protein molybdopterin-binding subunit [Ilumatobacter sp.]
MSPPEPAPRPGLVGRSVARREDERFLRGEGRYVADLATSSTLHVAFLRSPHAHARVNCVDVSAARVSAGVVAAFSGRELFADSGSIPYLHRPDPTFVAATGFWMADVTIRPMATEWVRYVGEPVAVVVALDRYLAEDALDLVHVEYDAVDAVVDADAALAEGAPLVQPEAPGNLAASMTFRLGDPAAGFAAAAVIVENSYDIARQGGLPMEGRGVFARRDLRTGRVELHTSTQIPHQVRGAVATALGWPRERIRVVVPDVGGGFGPKANVQGEEVVLALLADRVGGELLWVEDRTEHLVACPQGRDQRHRARLAVDQDGRILAFADEFVVDVGSFSLWTAGIMANSAIHLIGPYRIPAMQVDARAAFSNKTPSAQYRGAGRPEACFVLERCLDQAAHELGIDGLEIRRRNVLTGTDLPHAVGLPYRDGRPIVFDGLDWAAVLDRCAELLPPEPATELPDGRRVGHGVACYIEATGRGPYEAARVALQPDGTFAVCTGAASSGQSHETVFAQIAADALGVDLEQVTVEATDTATLAFGVGSFASRSAILAGSALHVAALQLAERVRDLARRLLDVDRESVAALGAAGITIGERTLAWGELAAALLPSGHLAGEPPIEATHLWAPDTVTWTMGAHAALVAVDPASGMVEVLEYAVAHEGGREINPRVVLGQVLGGVTQGLGGALSERFEYGPDGQPMSTSLATYQIPGALDVPRVRIAHLEAPTPTNPLGVRGVGESGTIGVYAAIAAAVDAAVACGAVHSVPIDAAELVGRMALAKVVA